MNPEAALYIVNSSFAAVSARGISAPHDSRPICPDLIITLSSASILIPCDHCIRRIGWCAINRPSLIVIHLLLLFRLAGKIARHCVGNQYVKEQISWNYQWEWFRRRCWYCPRPVPCPHASNLWDGIFGPIERMAWGLGGYRGIWVFFMAVVVIVTFLPLGNRQIR